MRRIEGQKEFFHDLDYVNQQQDKRDLQYRNKINKMNDKIYDNVMNFNKFVNGRSPEPYHVFF